MDTDTCELTYMYGAIEQELRLRKMKNITTSVHVCMSCMSCIYLKSMKK
jgi:hypothetical protein